MRSSILSCFGLTVILLSGCESHANLVQPGSTPDDTSGGFQRASLTVTVTLSGDDSALASQLGIIGGVLPAASVTIARRATSGSEATRLTDEGGVASFRELVPGEYQVSAFRALTESEIQKLVLVNEQATSFAAAGAVTVSAPSTDAVVGARADREPSSLVISEVSITDPRLPSGNFYRFGHYLEVYNNTDTTIYLDGKEIVQGFIFVFDANETFNCESTQRWRDDPKGIWTWRIVEAFPGSGRDHPLAPGQAAVVATDAIDHRQVFPDLPDLSHADFEFIGSSDVDNPDVPNMVSLGAKFADQAFGHGFFFGLTQETLLLAEPVNVAELAKEDVPGVQGNPEHWRIPASKILDVVSLGPTPALEREIEEAGLGAPCDHFVNEKFDRAWAHLVDSSTLTGMQRRVIAVRNGRKILQRTKVSALDFYDGPMTPGFIPE